MQGADNERARASRQPLQETRSATARGIGGDTIAAPRHAIWTRFSHAIKTGTISHGRSGRMPRASSLNSVRLASYITGYTIVLVCFFLVWQKFSNLLYLSRDGEYNLLTSLAYRDWARAFDLTSINPLQGMTSMLTAMNPYLNPGQWVFFADIPRPLQVFLSYGIYSCEIFLSTLLLGQALRLPRLFSFAASLWVALLLVPPFNFFFGLGGWLATAPMYGHALALTNLCIVVYLQIGVRTAAPLDGCSRLILRNLFLTACLFGLLLAMLTAGPFYNAGMMVGTALLLGCVFLSSSTREQMVWRIAAGVAILAAFVALRIPEFYLSSHAYSVRFATAQPALQIHWPKEFAWPTAQQWSNAWDVLCAWGVSCRPFPGWPISISSNWLHGAIIAGGFAMWLTMPRPASRIGVSVAVLWLALLCLWTVDSFNPTGALQLSPSFFYLSPSFIYLMMYSIFAILSLYIAYLPVRLIIETLPTYLGFVVEATTAFGVCVGIALLIDPLTQAPTAEVPPHRRTAITELLRQETALHPRERFRGSVATILGSPNGTLRKMLGLGATDNIKYGQFESLLAAAAKSGSTHDLLDLWTWNIPTLSEYGHGISRPLVFYVSKFLSTPGDAIEIHFVFPRVPNVDVLRAMGVGFMIIDAPVSTDGVKERMRLSAGDDAMLYLYELTDPNLGTFSPLQLDTFDHPDAFAARVIADPKVLQTTAFVENPVNVQLTPARNAGITFERGGIHVTASSDGSSALLLPVQFSHCYSIINMGGAATVMRANALHTLVLFERDLDMRLRWRFDFWRGSGCRAQDVNDLKALSLQ